MEENKPIINVKRFSRSKKNTEPIENTVEEVKEKKTRGRKKKVIINEEPVIEEPVIEEPVIEEPVIEEDIPEIESFEVDNDFLSELNNSNYQKEIEEEENKENNLKQQKELLKEQERQRKEQEKYYKQQQKEAEKKSEKVNKKIIESDNDLYSEGAVIQGSEKIKLIHKVKQYKHLFPEIPEIKNFKIKPNASEAELKNYIIELETLSSISSVDAFLTDSILQCIKVIELPTSKTKNFNITGLSDLLKTNKQFHTLCKKLYLKYGAFDKIPDEYQLLILVSTTAYVCVNKNKGQNEIENYLNETIEFKK